jgi:hypothetical protein
MVTPISFQQISYLSRKETVARNHGERRGKATGSMAYELEEEDGTSVRSAVVGWFGRVSLVGPGWSAQFIFFPFLFLISFFSFSFSYFFFSVSFITFDLEL